MAVLVFNLPYDSGTSLGKIKLKNKKCDKQYSFARIWFKDYGFDFCLYWFWFCVGAGVIC